MPSIEFHKLLEECGELHDKKSHDYANDSNPFANFEKTAELISWFTNPIDQTFAALIGVKLARLSELYSTGKEVNNESLDDTHVDLINYCGLWAAYKRTNSRQVRKSVSPSRK